MMNERAFANMRAKTKWNLAGDMLGQKMNHSGAKIRIFAQLVLAGPILVQLPLALLLGFVMGMSALKGGLHASLNGYAFGFGWIGILGLLCSIIIPLRIFDTVRWLRVLIALSVFYGIATAVVIVSSEEVSDAISKKKEWGAAWLFIGPVIVGLWNLWRIFIRPNLESSVERSRHRTLDEQAGEE